MSFVDLHIHSYFSDGTMSPVEILDDAIKKDVMVLSITDHDILQGASALMELCSNQHVRCISGVELDAVQDGVNYHILGYGMDLQDNIFVERVALNRQRLEEVNIRLIQKMQPDYPSISLDDYDSFFYRRELGGWKALHYFVYKGLTESLDDGYSFYANYKHSYTCVDFPDIQTVCQWIHDAGGVAILAHPGKVIRYNNMSDFENQIGRLLLSGLDGIECYYPSHSQEMTDVCLRLCKMQDLIVTSGSDCHGTFEDTNIGQLLTQIESVGIERI